MRELNKDFATWDFNGNCYLLTFPLLYLNSKTIYYAALESKYLVCSKFIHQRLDFTRVCGFQLSNQNGSKAQSRVITISISHSLRGSSRWLFGTSVPVCKMGVSSFCTFFSLLNCWLLTGFYSQLIEKI